MTLEKGTHKETKRGPLSMAGLSFFRTFNPGDYQPGISKLTPPTAVNFIIIHGKKLFKQTVILRLLRYTY
jgi:hypothetical protein